MGEEVAVVYCGDSSVVVAVSDVANAKSLRDATTDQLKIPREYSSVLGIFLDDGQVCVPLLDHEKCFERKKNWPAFLDSLKIKKKKKDAELRFVLHPSPVLSVNLERRAKDVTVVDYLQTNAAGKIVQGHWPCGIDDATYLGGIQVQVSQCKANHPTRSPSWLKGALGEFVPPFAMKTKKATLAAVKEEYIKHTSQTKSILQLLYLLKARRLPWYGSVSFPCTYLKKDGLVLVGPQGVSIVSPKLDIPIHIALFDVNITNTEPTLDIEYSGGSISVSCAFSHVIDDIVSANMTLVEREAEEVEEMKENEIDAEWAAAMGGGEEFEAGQIEISEYTEEEVKIVDGVEVAFGVIEAPMEEELEVAVAQEEEIAAPQIAEAVVEVVEVSEAVVEEQTAVVQESVVVEEQTVAVQESVVVEEQTAAVQESVVVEEQTAAVQESVVVEEQTAVVQESMGVEEQTAVVLEEKEEEEEEKEEKKEEEKVEEEKEEVKTEEQEKADAPTHVMEEVCVEAEE